MELIDSLGNGPVVRRPPTIATSIPANRSGTIGSRQPDQWRQRLPATTPIRVAGQWIGRPRLWNLAASAFGILALLDPETDLGLAARVVKHAKRSRGPDRRG